jgi:circadian clock protein KaiC
VSLNLRQPAIEKLPTGISGFDLIANGGIPAGRTTLVSGTAGSAKTVFAAQFLAEGIRKYGEHGVFVTFEEPPSDIRRNMESLGWDIATWESEGKWAFVDASPQPGEEMLFAGNYDLGALLARIENAVRRIGARRLSMDSLGAIFTQFADSAVVRRELFRVVSALKRLGVTAIMTGERTQEYGDIARYGVEEFVADNVIILRNVLEDEKRRRTIEILKFRGTSHQKGEFPFTIISGEGMVVIPLSAIELKQRSSDIRVTSGNPELDRMCGGGFLPRLDPARVGCDGHRQDADDHRVHGRRGQPGRAFACCLHSRRVVSSCSAMPPVGGIDFEQMERDGLLRVVCEYPETAGLEDHLIAMKKLIQEFRPNRVAVDSLSALERVSTIRGFREFVISLTSFIKHQEIAGLFTATTPSLMGGESVTETHISTLTDSIILLRLCRDVRRDAPRVDGAEDARLDAR